jgi:Fur family ferric uptake transcriptional regulator
MNCNRIVEFEDHNIDLLETCITKRLGFTTAKKNTRIEAACDEFARSGTCPHRERGGVHLPG